MRGRWSEFVRIGSIVVGGFLLLQLVVVLVDAASRGWPGGAGYTYVIVASTLASASEFMPVAVLVGAALAWRPGAATSEGAGPSAVRVGLAAALIAILTFLMDGFLAAHLLHHARLALLPEPGTAAAAHPTAIAIRQSEPNDWLFFASRMFDPPPGMRRALTIVHAGVAFPLLVGLMLPLGRALGRAPGARRQSRRVYWGMLAATTMLIYAAQMATWYLASYMEDGLPSPRFVYGGYLIVPLAMLLALAWAGDSRPRPSATAGASASGVA